MTRFEDLERRAHLCWDAYIRCVKNQRPEMAAIWRTKASKLITASLKLTIEQAEAKA